MLLNMNHQTRLILMVLAMAVFQTLDLEAAQDHAPLPPPHSLLALQMMLLLCLWLLFCHSSLATLLRNLQCRLLQPLPPHQQLQAKLLPS